MTHNQKIWVSRKESASRPLVTDPKDVLLFVENGNSCYAKLIVMWQGRDLPSLTYSIMSSNKRFYRVKEPQGKLIKHEAVLIYLKLKSPFLEQHIKDRFRLEVRSSQDPNPILTKEFKVAIKNEKVEYVFKKQEQPAVVNPSISGSLTKFSIASRMSNEVSNSHSRSRSVVSKNKVFPSSVRASSHQPKKSVDIAHERSIKRQQIRYLKEALRLEEELLADKKTDASWKRLLCYVVVAFICYLLGIVANVLTH